ncbi:DUF6843 domain-containing protein [Peribacillus sp. SCS-155]|uniref:DUF6843 domain-containing protein n=1 Tax=Peribacillus sedimenti TaxID=3115297 RepID=UPI0039059829
MNYLRVILYSLLASVILSLLDAWWTYVSLSERDPRDMYYPSYWESFLWGLFFLVPALLISSTLAFVLYAAFRKYKRFPRWVNVSGSILVSAGLTSLAFYLLGQDGKTHDIYLIPQGYEGNAFAFYNVKGAPKVKMEDGYEVHTINKKGYFVTSTQDMDYGEVTDRYYYVDKRGNRTPIKQECVHTLGNGGVTADGADFIYTGIQVTKNQCGEEFMSEGSGNKEYSSEIYDEIISTYYSGAKD